MKKTTYPLTLIGAACAAVVLAACGGGGSSSAPATATPAPPPAVLGKSTVSGTVTGFGSIIVDGVRIDDKAVAAGKERADGVVTTVELKLGQHVEVEHDGNLVATKIRVSAEAEGSVAAVDLTANTLTVLGQTVTINTDAALGPVTVFGAPYTALADVKVTDAVEIHGLISAANGKVTLQATRIEKKSVDVADRVNGIIYDLAAGAHTFKVGGLLIDYSGATLLPAGVVLANGNEVSVAIPLGTVEKGTAVKASAIKVKDRKADTLGKVVEVGGVVSAFDTQTLTLTVNGVQIDVSKVKFDQAGKGLADLKPGAYIVVKGTYGDANVLKAATVVIRGVDHEKDQEVELHGTVVDFKSVADFKVRGVAVDATGVVIDPLSCGEAHLANDRQVAVFGSLSASGVVKSSAIKCEQVVIGAIVVTREGKIVSIDTAAKTFSITTSKGTLTVHFGDATTYVDVEPGASLIDKYVSVEATLTADGLEARKVSLIK